MIVSIIVAVGNNGVIGNNGALPWPKLPRDLRYFREMTSNHPVIMGRKTYESIGKPLPGRTNILLTKQENYFAPGCLVAATFPGALALARTSPGSDEVFAIGGAEIYRLALLVAHRIYFTHIQAEFPGDTFFPEFTRSEWVRGEIKKHEKDEKNPFDLSFETYYRV